MFKRRAEPRTQAQIYPLRPPTSFLSSKAEDASKENNVSVSQQSLEQGNARVSVLSFAYLFIYFKRKNCMEAATHTCEMLQIFKCDRNFRV